MENVKAMMKDGKVLLIITLLIVIIAMSMVCVVLAKNLNIQETKRTNSDANWEIKITDIQVLNQTSTASPGVPSHTDTTATLAATLTVPGDTVTYEVTVQNSGNIDAVLESQTFVEGALINESNLIIYTYSQLPDELNAGDTTKFTVTASYDAETTQDQINASLSNTKTITGTFNYKQKGM